MPEGQKGRRGICKDRSGGLKQQELSQFPGVISPDVS